ncbi:MAG: hypothetical protein H5T86_07515, partial [Armatimonadetes bacterium]|nr:hypothetical protein [Armatimonadota bacterium]
MVAGIACQRAGLQDEALLLWATSTEVLLWTGVVPSIVALGLLLVAPAGAAADASWPAQVFLAGALLVFASAIATDAHAWLLVTGLATAFIAWRLAKLPRLLSAAAAEFFPAGVAMKHLAVLTAGCSSLAAAAKLAGLATRSTFGFAWAEAAAA